jgi:hypothetical protein
MSIQVRFVRLTRAWFVVYVQGTFHGVGLTEHPSNNLDTHQTPPLETGSIVRLEGSL